MSTPIKLRHRPVRLVPAALVALVLTLVGAAAVVLVIIGLAQNAWTSSLQTLDSTAGQSAWNSWPVLTAGAVLALIGLVLILAALIPGRYNAAPLNTPDHGSRIGSSEIVLTSSALSRLAAAHADQVDGVEQVSAGATPSRIRIAVRTSSSQRSEVADAVRRRVTDALGRAGLTTVPRVDVDVRPTRR